MRQNSRQPCPAPPPAPRPRRRPAGANNVHVVVILTLLDLLPSDVVADFLPAPRPPGKPTRHAPGSDEKIIILRQRFLRGEALFHPDDEKTWENTPDAGLLFDSARNRGGAFKKSRPARGTGGRAPVEIAPDSDDDDV
jgi:hypothetical protein